jgi:hypothetical protein
MIFGVLVFVIIIIVAMCICIENKCSDLLVVMVFCWTDIFHSTIVLSTVVYRAQGSAV